MKVLICPKCNQQAEFTNEKRIVGTELLDVVIIDGKPTVDESSYHNTSYEYDGDCEEDDCILCSSCGETVELKDIRIEEVAD